MWEEDPRWQDANCRFLIGFLKVTGILSIAVSICFRTWEPLINYLKIVGFCALCIGIYGLIGLAIVKTFLFLRHWLHK